MLHDHVGMADEPRTLTIPTFLASAVERRRNEPALGTIRGGELEWRTWREIWQDAADASRDPARRRRSAW